jgi:glutathione synthase
MGLAVAIQMDPIDTINIDADSTFALALEAQARGHALFHYLPQALTLRDGRLYARGRKLEVFRRHGNHHRFGDAEELDLAGFDIVLMRQDPPFDMAYITATHLLELLPAEGPLVVNDPAAVRNAPEKLFVLRFKELMPPTLLTLDPEEIRAFWQEHGDIILKPLFGNGGAGVFHLRPGDENLNSLLEMYARVHREPVMVQRYVPEVRQGDKRIILVEGEPVGAVNRVPPEGEARANLHVGGSARKTALTGREREICTAIGPTLRQQGLVFVGIDVIGDYMTEINVTSPTGIRAVKNVGGPDIAKLVWDKIEAKRRATS